MKYFYLLPSLPLLLFHRKPSINTNQFLQHCRAQCSDADFQLVQAAVLKPVRTHENNRFLHAWSMREISIAVRLAVFRRQKVSFIPPHEISLPDSDEGWQIVRRMTTAAHPAEAELILDKSRWEYLEELEQGHFFELDNLLAYYLKLQILERRFSMTEEKGRKEYEIIIDRQKKQFSDVRLSGTK